MGIVVKDGVRYLLHEYKKEAELEKLVKKHVNFIFGKNSLFLDKTIIKSRADIGSMPDGFVLLPAQQRWCIVEVELSQHHPHKHIVPQLSNLYSATKNPAAKNELIEKFYEEIMKHPELYKFTGVKGDTHKLLTDIINKDPEVVVIIDEKTSKLEDVCSNLSFTPRFIKFKTYLEEDSNFPIYIFDVLEEFIAEKPVIPTTKIPSPGYKTINRILGVAKLVCNQGKSYTEAVKIVAKRRGVRPSAVRDKCTCRIGLNTDIFKELLKDKEKLINFLIEKFPDNITLRRIKFWEELLRKTKKETKLFDNTSSRTDNWVDTSARVGIPGVAYMYRILKDVARVELAIDTEDKARNKEIFNSLQKKKSVIEKNFGARLEWNYKKDTRHSNIVFNINGGLSDKKNWESLQDQMIDAMIKLHGALDKHLRSLKKKKEQG